MAEATVTARDRERGDLTETDLAALERLRGEFDGRWHIWPGRRGQGRPSRLWCATRTDPDAGVDKTVIEESPALLVSALLAQAEAVRRGEHNAGELLTHARRRPDARRSSAI